MMRPAGEVAVYVCREAVDFRKSIDGLSALVTHTLGKDPFAAQLYVFANRRRDKVKIRKRSVDHVPRQLGLGVGGGCVWRAGSRASKSSSFVARGSSAKTRCRYASGSRPAALAVSTRL